MRMRKLFSSLFFWIFLAVLSFQGMAFAAKPLFGQPKCSLCFWTAVSPSLKFFCFEPVFDEQTEKHLGWKIFELKGVCRGKFLAELSSQHGEVSISFHGRKIHFLVEPGRNSILVRFDGSEFWRRVSLAPLAY